MKKKKDDNKKKYLTIVAIILAGVAVIIGSIKFNKEVQDKPSKNNESRYLGFFEERILNDTEDNYVVIKSYEEYEKYFNDSIINGENSNYEESNKLTENDFKKNNYILLEETYDGCSEYDIKLKDYSIENNNMIVNFTYKAKCGLCAPYYTEYLIPISKNQEINKVTVNSKKTNNPHCDPDIAYKPMIYIYPDKELDVSIKLGNEDGLITTYPKYNKGWEVKAYPSGKLIDKNTGKELYALYWEGNNYEAQVTKEGFVVKGEDVAEFLEDKLSILGLNAREREEFIVYWLSSLESNKYNYIRFTTKEEIDNYMPLDINPQPDNIIRVMMEWKALDNPIKVKEQVLNSPVRTGYTVVEWGGTILK